MTQNCKIRRAREGFLWVVCSILRTCEYNRRTNHGEGKGVFEKDIPYSYARIPFFSRLARDPQIKAWHQDILSFQRKRINWYGARGEQFIIHKRETRWISHERYFQ